MIAYFFSKKKQNDQNKDSFKQMWVFENVIGRQKYSADWQIDTLIVFYIVLNVFCY